MGACLRTPREVMVERQDLTQEFPKVQFSHYATSVLNSFSGQILDPIHPCQWERFKASLLFLNCTGEKFRWLPRGLQLKVPPLVSWLLIMGHMLSFKSGTSQNHKYKDCCSWERNKSVCCSNGDLKHIYTGPGETWKGGGALWNPNQWVNDSSLQHCVFFFGLRKDINLPHPREVITQSFHQ